MKFLLYIIAGVIFMSGSSFSQKISKNINYKDADTELEGYLACPNDMSSKLPTIIVVHEWNGINDYTKMRCEQLAKMGYVAFAADIYGKGNKPKNMEESGKMATIYKNDRSLYKQRMIAALNTVKNMPNVDGNKIAAIGYCFGGTGALELARSGANINGIVTFHGGLSSANPEEAKNIKCKVLVLHGADDPFVKQEEVAKFENEMREAGADWQLIKYSGAVHSFTNPSAGNDNSKGAAYNEKADHCSWEAMKTFFAEIFK